ncbi:MAG: stress protein, partial [Actinobacteria bacterium]|nr:stress protein [Actinomycetota bacterium]
RPAAAPATPAAAPDELTGLLRSLVQALNREPGPLPASGDGGPPGPPRQAQPPPGQAQARPGQGCSK